MTDSPDPSQLPAPAAGSGDVTAHGKQRAQVLRTESKDVSQKTFEDARKDKKLTSVLEAWEEQSQNERELRKSYAKWLIWALFAQIGFVNLAFFLIGWEMLTVDEWTARTFIVSVFTELAAMVFFIVRYLFAPADANLLRLIEKL